MMTIFHSHRATRIFLACCLSLAVGSLVRAELSVEQFRNPPQAAKPGALWTWINGHVDKGQITRELEEMKDKGMRGAIIWDLGAIIDPEKIIPAGPAFMGPDSLPMIHHAMDEAERLGLELGMVAASSWNSGGPWITPDHGVLVLSWSELKIEGPVSHDGPLPMPEKASGELKEVAAMAIGDDGKLINLSEKVGPGGKLKWDAPAGKWSILRFVERRTGENLKCPSPNSSGLVIDHLSRDATDLHVKSMLDALSRGREDFGGLKLLMLDSYEVKPGKDWTPGFVAKFRKRYGYDPIPWLPALAGVAVGEKGHAERFVHDYQKLVSDLMIDDHYGRVRELLNQRGLKLLAEAGHGGHARVEPLRALGVSDIPMGEFWNHRKNWVTKEAASAANIYGKTLVNSESFTGWQHWQDGPAAYKRLLDIALCAGLNQVTFHTFAHQPPGSGLPGYAYHAGEHFNVNLTWWDEAGPMLADMARSCHLLQQGRIVADVAAYYGDEAPNLVPARRIAPTDKPNWPEGHCQHCGRLEPVDLSSLGHGYDYDYVNEDVILNRMRVEDGRIVFPDGMNYRMLVLPEREAISLQALERIGVLVEQGATVVGAKPLRSNSLAGYPNCDTQVRELADRIWGDCDGKKVHEHVYGKGRVIWNRPLAEVLGEMGVGPDFEVEGMENPNREIDYIHRETAKEDIYLVANTTMESASFVARFRVNGDRVPSFWNAENGTVTPCHRYEVEDGFIRVPLELAPASSIFVVFSQQKPGDPIVKLEAASRVDITAKDGAMLKLRAWQAGELRVATAAGLSASTKVEQVPAAQVFEGPWQLSFPPDRGAPKSVTLETLIDWTKHADPGVRHFSGTATYSKSFQVEATVLDASDAVMLDLGAVGEVARVRINGKDAGVVWKAPWSLDVRPFLKAGENALEIEVTNSWNNRLVGDQSLKHEDRITRTNLMGKFSAKSPLIASGLMGPVSLRFGVPVSLELK